MEVYMDKNETIHDRITQLVNRYGEGKNTVFASIIGSNEANVRGYRTSTMPKFDFLEKIARNLDINLDWLLTGRGQMEKSVIPARDDEDGDYDDRSVPIVDISVAAGCEGYDNPGYLEVYDNIRMPSVMLKKNCQYYCVRVKGESMTPTILDSSFVIVRLLDKSEWEFMPDNHVYVISDREGRAYIKRVKNRLHEHGFIVCMSDNVDKANYPNFNLQEEEIHSILHAEWHISAKMPNINETYYKKVNDLEDKYDRLENQMQKVLNAIGDIR